MLMNLLNGTGERTEAVLLATGDNKMRIVVKGLKDATELRLVEDQWISENGVAVDIESLIAIDGAPIDLQVSIAATNGERAATEFHRGNRKAPRTMTAGS
jgi:hypothetical protein